MKIVAALLTFIAVTLWTIDGDTGTADCRNKGPMVSAARHFEQSIVTFYQLVQLMDYGRFVSGYSQVGHHALALAKQARRVQRMVDGGVSCKDLDQVTVGLEDNVAYIDRMLSSYQYGHYRSDIIRSWRRVKASYQALLDSMK